jgi:4-amino-4-deoxy-L-arabinose transferase-like glycosyltransferase
MQVNVSVPNDRVTSLMHSRHGQWLTVLGILVLATVLRAWNLGELSFWYDEVVTMRLARSPSIPALFDRLFQIDATRAPLHPLLLQGWVQIFGLSEGSARALSVLCGVVTVGLIYLSGALVFGRATGLWSAWLAALSPLLVYYSREARMYSWLVLVTSLSWGLLFAIGKARGSERRNRADSTEEVGTQVPLQPPQQTVSPHRLMLAYSLNLTALLYSHPLGLIMAGTLALASFLFLESYFRSLRHWIEVHLAPLVVAAPWIRHYFDHPAEFLSGRLPIKFLLGTPIGFIGGNSLVLLGIVVVIALGLWRRRQELTKSDRWSGPALLVLWLVLPPVILYAYSWIGSPIFGPARYTLFVAPAYLILVAQGLSSLPPVTRSAVGIGLALLAAQSLDRTVYAPGLKADWRAFSTVLTERMARTPGEAVTVLVKSEDPARNVEVDTARYYLPEKCQALPLEAAVAKGLETRVNGPVLVAIGAKDDPSGVLQEYGFRSWVLDGKYPGLAVYRVNEPSPGVQHESQRQEGQGLPDLD